MNLDRRNFLKQSALASSVLAGLGSFALSDEEEFLAEAGATNLTILFQGDSITDAGRNRDRKGANNGGALGTGYAFQATSQLLGKTPGAQWQCYNKGISGNKVYQLADRWQEDCLDLKPDVLSILIGVNDYWHMLNGKYDGTVAIYENDYRALLQRTLKALPNVKLIICEPFGIKGGTAIKDGWYPNFDEYRAAAARIATEFDAVFVPYQKIFEKALEKAPVSYWCPDGVHPSIAGGHLMAAAWLKALKKAL